MSRLLLLCVVLLSAIFLIAANMATDGAVGQTPASRSDVERGKYLVEQVAKCRECHTPRDDQGQLKTSAWLAGATIRIQPVARISNGADSAPPLAGLPSLTDAQMETVLEKGTGPEGETLRPPMPIDHLHRMDAKAIIAYLKLLPRGPVER
jgi:mono/diheme cytochrome c family protein